jgi:hypothetical protein
MEDQLGKANKGTCQLILNLGQVSQQLGRRVDHDTDIMKLRDDNELLGQKEVKNKYLTDTLVKDELFKGFSEFLKSNSECK